MTGPTNNLDNAGSLETVLLASNYFSCYAPSMDHSMDLGTGQFRNPLTRAVREAGNEMSRTPPFMNPYDEMPTVELPNTVWAFPGCSQLTGDVCTLNSDTPTRFLSEDAVRKGSMEPFTGDSAMKMLLWVTLPALVLAHSLAVGVTLYRHPSGAANAFKLYFRPRMGASPGNLIAHLYMRSIPCLFLLMLVSCFMLLLNGISAGIFQQHSGCTDPLVRVSIASVRLYSAYQWIWSLSSCVTTVIIALIVERLRSDNLVRHAQSVHDCLMTLINLVQPPHTQALKQWSSSALQVGGCSTTCKAHARRVLYYVGMFALNVGCSLPAFGYVLGQVLQPTIATRHSLCLLLLKNVPTGSGFVFDMLKNSIVVTLFKLGKGDNFWLSCVEYLVLSQEFQHSLFRPAHFGWLNSSAIRYINVLCLVDRASGRHGGSSHNSLVAFHKSVSVVMTGATLVTVLLAPIVAVFALDENCEFAFVTR